MLQDSILQGFMLMLFGMGGIFLVLTVIYLTIKVLNKIFTPAKEEQRPDAN